MGKLRPQEVKGCAYQHHSGGPLSCFQSIPERVPSRSEMRKYIVPQERLNLTWHYILENLKNHFYLLKSFEPGSHCEP